MLETMHINNKNLKKVESNVISINGNHHPKKYNEGKDCVISVVWPGGQRRLEEVEPEVRKMSQRKQEDPRQRNSERDAVRGSWVSLGPVAGPKQAETGVVRPLKPVHVEALQDMIIGLTFILRVSGGIERCQAWK